MFYRCVFFVDVLRTTLLLCAVFCVHGSFIHRMTLTSL